MRAPHAAAQSTQDLERVQSAVREGCSLNVGNDTVINRRIVLTANDRLWRRTHSVLLHIFCRGVAAAPRSCVMAGALLDLLLSPLLWALAVARRTLHFVVLYILWWILRDLFVPYETALLVLGIVAILYRDLYDAVKATRLTSSAKPL